MIVMIKRGADGYDAGEIDVEKIFSVRWDNQSGGYQRRHAGYSLYGYVSYDEGKDLVACSGRHGHYNNVMKVMIPASLNKKQPYREGYDYLASLAKPKVSYMPGPPCIEAFSAELANGPVELKQLKNSLENKGYSVEQIRGAINNMVKSGQAILKGKLKNRMIEKVNPMK